MLAADFLDRCKTHYPDSNNSETVQIRYSIRFLENYLSTIADEFGPLKLKAVRDKMLRVVSDKTGKPYSRQYVNRMVDREASGNRKYSSVLQNDLRKAGSCKISRYPQLE